MGSFLCHQSYTVYCKTYTRIDQIIPKISKDMLVLIDDNDLENLKNFMDSQFTIISKSTSRKYHRKLSKNHDRIISVINLDCSKYRLSGATPYDLSVYKKTYPTKQIFLDRISFLLKY